MGILLDPSLAAADEVLFVRDKDIFTVGDIEERFSFSVKDGLKLVGGHLETLDRDVLGLLAQADESLVEDRFPRNQAHQVRLLQSTLRQFAGRLVKRSIGTRRGVCRDVAIFRAYEQGTQDVSQLNDIRKELKKLLHDKHNYYRAGLATTFGQPIAERSRDVVLLLPSTISVQEVRRASSQDRPRDPLPYLQVDKHFVPLTFDLFKALREVSNGLHDASLSGEIYSLLDRVRSLVSGKVVRDSRMLNDDPVIMLGPSNGFIEYISGSFRFNKGTGG